MFLKNACEHLEPASARILIVCVCAKGHISGHYHAVIMIVCVLKDTFWLCVCQRIYKWSLPVILIVFAKDTSVVTTSVFVFNVLMWLSVFI